MMIMIVVGWYWSLLPDEPDDPRTAIAIGDLALGSLKDSVTSLACLVNGSLVGQCRPASHFGFVLVDPLEPTFTPSHDIHLRDDCWEALPYPVHLHVN